MGKWNSRCRFFNDKYACETLTTEGYLSCEECKFASPYSHKILIIKLGALGDVLRTTPILEAIKKKAPESLIYWITSEESKELLEGNSYIDKVLTFDLGNILRLQQEKFDVVFSLEIDTPATLLANLVSAKEKVGYYFDEGVTSCFNESAKEYLETAFLTHVKLKNRKTYQELIFKTCELPYEKEEMILEVDKNYGENFLREKGISGGEVIGLNFNAGSRWPSKSWAKEKVKDFVRGLKDSKVILLGGKSEKEKINELILELRIEGIEVFSNDFDNSVKEFASLVLACDKMIVTDSLGLHISLVMKKPTVALFFSTPSWEIEGYGFLKRLQSPLFDKYFFSNNYSGELANSILVEEVLNCLKQ